MGVFLQLLTQLLDKGFVLVGELTEDVLGYDNCLLNSDLTSLGNDL